MADVLIASDAPWVHDEVISALPRGLHARSLVSGTAVRGAVKEEAPKIAVLDSQIESMGAFAVTYDLHNEESGGRLPHIPVLILLDRQADVYLARTAGAEGWLVKPLDPIRLREAITEVMAGRNYEDRAQFGDASTNYKPTPDAAAR